MKLIVRGSSHLISGELEIPVSKYHIHRALILASLAPGTSVISGISAARQVEWTISVLRALGTQIEIDTANNRYIVTGGPYRTVDVDEHGTHGDEGVLNVGSSGTTLYFMTGLVSLADRPKTLTGMKYFHRRPIKALLDSLSQMGVQMNSDNDCPPIMVEPVRPLGGDVSISGTLSQWLSGLLLLAPFATRDTRIRVTGGHLNERPYVALTVRMMRDFGLHIDHDDEWLTYRIPGNQTAIATQYQVPPDIGSAAFGVAAAAMHPSDVLLRGLCATSGAEVDHPEAEFLDLASQMGVPLEKDPVTGFVRIRHDGGPLQPIDVDCTPIPDLLPVLSAMASTAEGTSTLRNIGHIRLKESDRVFAMLQLNRMGGVAEQSSKELRITGVERLHAASLSSFNDHRVLMSLAIAATSAPGQSTLTYPHAYRVSYPTFLEAMTSVGLDLTVDTTRRRSGPECDSLKQSCAPSNTRLREEDLTPLVLSEAVRSRAESAPNEIAVLETSAHKPLTKTWRELQDEADKVSFLLRELGVHKGEAVAIQLPNWSEFITISLGIMQIGAVVTPIMQVFGPRETAMTLSRSRARVMFLPNMFRNRRPPLELVTASEESRAFARRLALEHVVVVQAEARHRPNQTTIVPPVPDRAIVAGRSADWTWHYYRSALASMTPDVEYIRSLSPDPDDVCQLLFTSGTTGEPKGVQHTHRTLSLAAAMEVAHLHLGTSDRIFVPSPLAHQTGFLYGMLLAWRIGVGCVIQPTWDAALALDQAFSQGRATFVQAATPFLTDLVDLVENGAAAPESLRMFVATGAAVPRALAQKATKVLGTAVLGAFGTTETCLATLASPTDAPEDASGSDGRPLKGIHIRIVDDDGQRVDAGCEGNFELNSPTVFSGYRERQDLTADVFTSDGWYRTGDLAFIDKSGFLHITGRVKDVINRGGEKIPVVEIENLLYQHPLVSDIAIVAMPHPRLGERACAFIVPARSDAILGFHQMQEYLRAAGASKYYWPERLEFLDELPRNAVGKIQKNVLRETAAHLVAAKEMQ